MRLSFRHKSADARKLAAAALAACALGVGAAFAGHGDIDVDPSLKRYNGIVIALGSADAEGRILSFRAAPLGPEAPRVYVADELRGWRLTLLTGRRFASVFEVETNTESEISVRAIDGALNGLSLRDVFVVEQIAIQR